MVPKTAMLAGTPTLACQRKAETFAAIRASTTVGNRLMGTSLLRGNMSGGLDPRALL
jgi:hypothetical protein